MTGRIPLVLLPGLLCDGDLWRHQADSLADLADPWVADLTHDDSLEAMAHRVLNAAPERFALAGLSMGGYLAMEIMRQAPERVERLALLDTTHRPDPEENRRRRKELIRISGRGQFRGVTTRLLPMLIHDARLGDEELTETVMAMAERVGQQAFVRQQTAILNRPDSTPDLPTIRCPTLVLCGRQDQLTPPEVAEDLACRIPGARLVIVEEAGHLPPLERPHAVSAVMRYWLQI